MPLVYTDIIPSQKSDAPGHDQQHDRDIDDRTARITGEGGIEVGFRAKNVKPGVAECGYGMKHRHPNATPSIVPAEHRQHRNHAQQLHDKRPPQDKPCQPDDAADIWRGNSILHGAALHQGDFSPGQQRKGCRNGHNAKSSYLDQ